MHSDEVILKVYEETVQLTDGGRKREGWRHIKRGKQCKRLKEIVIKKGTATIKKTKQNSTKPTEFKNINLYVATVTDTANTSTKKTKTTLMKVTNA